VLQSPREQSRQVTTQRDGPVTVRVVEALRRIIRAVDLHSRDLVQKYRLTGPQLVVLRAIAESRPASVGEIARAVHLSQATVTGILDRLEARGLVARARSPDDRRRVVASLSPRAEEKLRATPPLLQEHFIRRFLELEESQQRRILSSLEEVVSLMEAGELDATPILATGPMSATLERTEAFLQSPAAPRRQQEDLGQGRRERPAREGPGDDRATAGNPERITRGRRGGAT
jgi:DNA-binding MarR family transcriptional regulator